MCCHSDEESPFPVDLTTGGERWPQALRQVEIICGRSSWQEMYCNMTMEVKAQIKRKWSNACEEREDSGGKDELLTLILTKLYSKGHFYFE